MSKITHYLKHDGSNYDEFIEAMPREAQAIMQEMETKSIDGITDYSELKEFQIRLEKLGYTFDYSLDAEPYEFKQIGAEVTEEEFWG